MLINRSIHIIKTQKIHRTELGVRRKLCQNEFIHLYVYSNTILLKDNLLITKSILEPINNSHRSVLSMIITIYMIYLYDNMYMAVSLNVISGKIYHKFVTYFNLYILFNNLVK